MTDREKLKRIAKLVNDLALDDMTLDKYNEEFPKQTIKEIQEELWTMYCFVEDVLFTIDMDEESEE